jgi:ribosomal protein S10
MYFNEYFQRIKLNLDSVDNNKLKAVSDLINDTVKSGKKNYHCWKWR